jgi:transcriptional accessory protein Tex/SPT6
LPLARDREREEEGSVWVTRPKRERQMSLTELKVGQSFEATVITVKEFGCYVDFGATRDGFVRLRVSNMRRGGSAEDRGWSI